MFTFFYLFCLFFHLIQRRPRAPVRVPYSAPVVPPPPPPPVAYGVNPGAAAGLGAYPVAQGYYRQPVPGAFYPPAYYRSPYSYPYPYPYAMVAGGAAGVGGLGMRHPPVVRSPKIQGVLIFLYFQLILCNDYLWPLVYIKKAKP